MLRATEYDRGVAPLALIVADPGSGAADAAEAIILAGGTFRGEADWRAACAGRFDHPGAIELIAVEAQHVSDGMLADALPRISGAIERTSARAVVALQPEQIDIVAAAMLGPRVELLCAPTIADRTAAFAVALAPFASSRVHDPAQDSESAQLRQLNEEVARISRVLARLTSEEKRTSGVADRPLGYGAPPATAPAASTITAAEVRKLIRARRMRNQYLAEDLFEDPAWDMLLDLYAADLESAQVSVSSLCIAAAVAPTTALRWIARMTEAGLFERHPDPFDRRRAFLALSDGMRAKLERYFAALRQSGLGVI
ncbi:MarR family winged helix-turn-helix transcriptional regulator [Sphingomonas sp.]|jgi:DNA-binding MarR family transcriptional regulator|uniref:MarR family winged helix-turn-helix transcriptional regulator n=1 Tax=Sphingomonas sp. TaxID=28214 RepID=UPI002E2EC42B|nr:MarR family winged helix-turn-helix transcriptional regulator [Sphingomonas sp.]HEX4695681.1 MarR family winged helix-turn-helix transcriptional regulator [Sphingomonas sp.]